MSHYINLFAYFLLGIFAVFAIIYIQKTKKNPVQSNPLFLQFLPGLFTTLGIFGTFLGIAYALYQFNVNDTEGSINSLLEGMKTAFFTSIIGILLSILFSFWIKYILHAHGASIPVPESEETKILKELVKETKSNNSTMLYILQKLDETKDALVSASNNSSAGLLGEIRNTNRQLVVSSEKAAENTQKMMNTLDRNHLLMVNKFDEFGRLLASANTEALQAAMESLINDFNDTFKTLITSLVNQNFDELNVSIKNLNTWQQTYKSILENQVGQLSAISEKLNTFISSIGDSQQATEKHLTKVQATLKEVAEHSKSLSSSEGKLAQITKALTEVLVEENTLTQAFRNATKSMDALKASSESFEDTKKRISEWLNNESRIAVAMPLLQASIAELKTTLNKLSGIKMEDLRLLDRSFDNRLQTALNSTFEQLDVLIKEYVKAIENNRAIEITINQKRRS